MSHKWWHKWGSGPEDEALEKLEELRAQENRILQSNEKYGEGAVELSKDDLKKIQEQIRQIKIDNPDVEAIQSGFAADDTGIFGIPQETDVFEKVKKFGVNSALDYAGVPGVINYDTIGDVKDTFQEEGVGGAADTILNIAKDRGVEAALQYATGIGVPLQVASQILNSSLLAPITVPFKQDAGNMFGDLTFGYGPKLYDTITSPLDFFGKNQRKGIFENQQNIVPVGHPPDPVQQPSVIDEYIASLNNPTVDDIQIQPLPVQINKPTMADVSGPSNNTNYSPQDMNIQPASAPPQSNNPYSRFGRFGRANGGLVSMARVLRR